MASANLLSAVFLGLSLLYSPSAQASKNRTRRGWPAAASMSRAWATASPATPPRRDS